MEIERKFLVKRVPGNLESFRKKSIEQGYISTSPTIRIRQSDSDYILTVKSSGQLIREEFEIAITKEEYLSLLKKVETMLVKKDRYLIPLNNGLTAELDIYYDFLEELKTVEVEFGAVYDAQRFIAPEWFGEDVTYDQRYSNSSLARYGLSLM